VNGPAVTLADVAREAGTSASTASRALSGRGYVAPDVRKRLLAVADRLGYVPNLSARTLKQRTSRVVGVVVSELGNQFYAALAAGVEQTLREANYQMLLLGDNSEVGQELKGVRTFLSMRAPGVIMTPVSNSAADLLVARGTPVVEVDRRLATTSCDAVVIDNERGAHEAVSHLLELGHTRVALLMAKTTWTTDAGRLDGYRTAHSAAGLRVDRRLVVKIPTHASDAHARIGALLDEERPTAIFAANNLLAERAWLVLRDRKFSIPDDMSLVAFDDVSWMGMVQPGITAVAQPTFEMGRRAALLLLRRLEDPTCGRTVEVLEPGLVVRGSSGPPAT
jgi:LacI family transcriptional regulator, galactose operon repressor